MMVSPKSAIKHRLTYIVDGGDILNSQKVVVANTRDDSLTFIDLLGAETEIMDLKESILYSGNRNMQNIYLGPYELEGDSRGNLYCTNVFDNSILKIDLKEKKVKDILAVGKNPTCIKCFENSLFIVNSDSNSVSVIDTVAFTLAENIQVGGKPVDIEIDEKSKKIYIASYYGQSIEIIDLISHDKTSIKIKNNPVKMILKDSLLFVLTHINNGVTDISNLSIIDLTRNVEINIGNFKGIFNDMMIIRGREIVFVTNMDNGYLYRMDIESRDLSSKTYLSGMPNKLGWDGEDMLFITNTSNNVLTLFDIKQNRIIDNIKVGKEPNGIFVLK